MKWILEKHSHETSPSFEALLQENLRALGKVLRIDGARGRVERNSTSSPPFRLAAHLVTPGPDVKAEAVDHTPRAALQNLFTQLTARFRHHNQKRDQHLNGPMKTTRKQIPTGCGLRV